MSDKQLDTSSFPLLRTQVVCLSQSVAVMLSDRQKVQPPARDFSRPEASSPCSYSRFSQGSQNHCFHRFASRTDTTLQPKKKLFLRHYK